MSSDGAISLTYSDPFSLAVIPSWAGLAWSPLFDRLLRHAEEYVWPILPPEPAQVAWTTEPNYGILKSMHKCRTDGLDKLNLWPFYHLTFKCDLDFQPTWTNSSNDIATTQREQLCQYFELHA